MKKSLFLLLLVLTAGVSTMQAQKFPGLDKSPLDISYYKPSRTEPPVAKVIYSRPQMNGRTIFGDLVPYGKVWRTGANESTEITFFKDVTLAGKKVKAGTYSLFTIPTDGEWTIILNSVLDEWGAYTYKEDKDVLRVQVPSTKADDAVEDFTIVFKPGMDGADMILAWDKTRVSVPISTK
ncbi:DUF2911 domain-containing protein [Zhouia sp. PK063]|uniref:DUF2911 domain-containing protein n=1 Tax=Zhouia sp. PK063 TaxID=3373602 RepID=UPI0037AB4600